MAASALDRRTVAVLAGLAALEFFIYFFHAGHFFQADTIYWFDHRLTSVGEFFRSFAAPDPGGWYRPLTGRTVQSLLYPVLGFNPAGYRWIQFLLFFADILAVFALTVRLAKRQTAGLIAAFFFTIHTVNAYTTYDLAFVPELAYTFFYIGAVLAFLRFHQERKPVYLVASFLSFALSLCSKESAVTLPAVLFALGWTDRIPLKRLIRTAAPHALLLAFYLVFTLGHLNVASEALASLHTPPAQIEGGGYYFMPGPHIFTNAARAWEWALNLPTGMLGQWRDTTRVRLIVFGTFACIQMLLLIYAAFRRRGRPVLAGLLWFWITVSPALPLMGHFLPYYLFLPIGGFAIIVGASWDCFFKDVGAHRPYAATVAAGLIIPLMVMVCSRTSRSEAKKNFLLGGSSQIAEASLQDMRRLFPSIRPGTRFVIWEESQPDLDFHQAGGGLFRLGYGDDSLRFDYVRSGTGQPPAGDKSVELIYEGGHLHPFTH